MKQLWNKVYRWFTHQDEWDKFKSTIDESYELNKEMIKDYEVLISGIK